MFWKIVVSALLLPSCLGFETAAAHITSKVQNQPQSQESALPVTFTLANQILMNSSTLADKEDVSIQDNFEADTTQLKQTKYEYYQRIHQQRLRRSRQRVCPDYRYHRRYNRNRVYYRQNHHRSRHYYRYQRQYQPQNYRRRHNYKCQYYSHGRCYN
ncbi:MAG: hypothetical protein ACR2LR_07345 [Hassallia sp.]